MSNSINVITNLNEFLLNTPTVGSISAESVLFTMGIATICAVAIYLVYRFFNRSVVYSANFNLLTVMVCLVTAFIIITIGANLVLSLGMVGALSIVRFRAAVKDPLDVGFLFWAVAAGLTAGAQLYFVALLGTACIALIFIAFSFFRAEKRSFLMIVRYSPENAEKVTPLISNIKFKLKNKTQSAEYVELTAEVKVKNNDTSFLQPLTESGFVQEASVVEYSGEFG
ncbi:MAG: DUF4956 domain-containing protein [Clostridiales bacterium]|jgi:hypothetical protein|nr:DUF4956 domain-containing protein [Clostridiales bacterium]